MKGYVDGIDWINAEAMKYWSFPSSYTKDKKTETRNMIYSGEYTGAIKVDGYYERLIKDEDGNCFMVARSKNVNGEAVEKIDWVPHIKSFMSSLPTGTVLLSECFLYGNEGSKKITSLLGCLKEKCIERQNKGQKLQFYVFDVMAYAGKNMTDIPFADRIECLREMSETYQDNYVMWARYYEGEALWNQLQTALADGREGMVIMRKDAPVYFKRTPARVSLKIKKELKESLDCFFTGRAAAPKRDYTGKEIEKWPFWINQDTDERLPFGNHYYEAFMEGKRYIPVTQSYYHHWAGSLEIGLVDASGAVVGIGYISGLPQEVKENYKDYKDCVIEIGAMELNDTGGLRHAKMIGWRDDKTWQECSLEQLKSL